MEAAPLWDLKDLPVTLNYNVINILAQYKCITNVSQMSHKSLKNKYLLSALAACFKPFKITALQFPSLSNSA